MEKEEYRSYKDAGVDIKKGDAFAAFISRIDSPAVSRGIGGFAGGIEPGLSGYARPVLMSTTDGVGTKLLVAKELGDYGGIGIDLVAMCVNDLIVCGAKPLQFLDYIACGRIDEELLTEVILGIVRGCEIAECSLGGGETAEMPDMYGKDDIDLAGFCTGIAEHGEILPKTSRMNTGDLIFGLPSAGVHSNGLSLARKIVPKNSELYRELLVPTKIYVREMKVLLAAGVLTGAAHITGGGLCNNIRRVLPAGLKPLFFRDWPVPSIFTEIRNIGGIEEEEMDTVFNMGIGIALIVPPSNEQLLKKTADEHNIILYPVGRLADG
jgi:phosphoribosylformylglycinamidine cyclo-ligase